VTDIQRYDHEIDGCEPSDDGSYVTYADHVEEVTTLRATILTMEADHLIALRQAERGYSETAMNTAFTKGYEQGQRDGLALRDVAWAEGLAHGIAQAVQRVEALDCQRIMATQSDGLPAAADYVERAAVIAAIKGEQAAVDTLEFPPSRGESSDSEDACTDGFDCPVQGHFHA
jgi:hypothetical protein